MNKSTSGGFFRRGNGLLFLPLSALLLWSCGSASKSAVKTEEPPTGGAVWEDETDFPPESSGEGPDSMLTPEGPDDDIGESPGTGEFPDEPGSVLTPENPAESPWPGELEEPLFDFPEAALEPPAPAERPLAALPEPLAPVFPEPMPEPAETGEAEAPVPAEEPPPSEEPVPPPTVSAPPPSPPPSPPPFIRPAEKYEAPPAREPARLPIPEPPARTPPVEIPEPGIVYSRVVRATVGQLVEIPFRGTGWVYLGELASRPGIVYGSRRLDPEGQSFIFRAEAAGTYSLKFYKQDFVRDYILNDHVQVIVGEPPEAAAMGWFNPSIDRGRVIAEPRWPSALEEADAPVYMLILPGVTQSGTSGTQGPAATQGGGSGAQGGTAAQGGTSGTQGPAATQGGGSGAQGGTATQGGGSGAQGGTAAQGGTGGAQGGAVTQGAAGAQGEASGTQGGAVTQGGAGTQGAAGGTQGAAVTQGPAEDAGFGDLRPGDYPERARQEFKAGRVASAISILDQFRERYPSGSDEAWWLYGQFYEANGPSRDIRSALDYYHRLVREYPQSPHYDEARRRIAYLERYYINIR